jgi:hypothetical protein
MHTWFLRRYNNICVLYTSLTCGQVTPVIIEPLASLAQLPSQCFLKAMPDAAFCGAMVHCFTQPLIAFMISWSTCCWANLPQVKRWNIDPMTKHRTLKENSELAIEQNYWSKNMTFLNPNRKLSHRIIQKRHIKNHGYSQIIFIFLLWSCWTTCYILHFPCLFYLAMIVCIHV